MPADALQPALPLRRRGAGRRWARRIGAFLLGMLLALLALANTRPSLAPFEGHALAAADAQPGRLRVTFIGVSTLLFDDGETAILTDGFFSRPGKFATLLEKIAPDPARIHDGLQRARIGRLAVVAPLHSHYDHALDAALVAQQTGALLVGSPSTAMIGRGGGLPEDRIATVHDGSVMHFGRFTLTWIASRHAPSPKPMDGEIAAPLVPPAAVEAYRDGGCWSLLIEHQGRRLLVQASAGFIKGALAGRQAEVVFLGVGLLSRQDDAYRADYWQQVVQAVGARRVVPIHWDDFWIGLDQPLVAAPWVTGNVAASLQFVAERAASEHVDLRLPRAFVAIDPFEALAAAPSAAN